MEEIEDKAMTRRLKPQPKIQLRMTQGVSDLIEECQCYWLIDAIASYQPTCMKDQMLKDIQFWELRKNPPLNLPKGGEESNEVTLYCYRDTNNLAFKQEIPYSDFFNYFDGEFLKIWVSDNVVMLPSEY